MSTVEAWLQAFIRSHGGAAGTVHAVAADDPDRLELVASLNIPPKVVEITRVIPKGKGMAGLALERERPVSTCNLTTDSSGDVRPGARAVDARAAVALPVRGSEGKVRAVVGIAYADERTLADDELDALTTAASSLPDGLIVRI
jgi:L-methionine (R)-S-oxide reductase